MKNKTSKTKIIRRSRFVRFLSNNVFKSIIIGTLILGGIYSPVQAQKTEYTNPSWWFGAAGGANINYYRGTTQRLTNDFITPSAFHKGMGAGVFAAPLIEYHRPNSFLGFMLQAGYDNRSGKFDQAMDPCNIPIDLKTSLDYITIEPSIRIAPFKSNFYLYAGPRFAFNMNKDFTYQKSASPNFPDDEADPERKGDFNEIEKFLISMQVGAGLDIPLASKNSRTKTMLSPFVSFQPYFGQDPRSIESWNMTNVRVGLALKFGRGSEVIVPEKVAFVPIIPQFRFAVVSPKNIPAERRIRETFPLLNYVFFNSESTDIPSRYVLLEEDQVKDFKEDQLEEFAPLNLSGRSDRQMTAYYNVLNIIGDRLGKNPSSSITLVGSSEKDSQEGRLMAESVKEYLIDIFGINESRVKIEVRDKPKLPSEQPGGMRELALLREEDRRVSVESGSPALLMEFQSETDTRLKPVELMTIQEAPLDSYVSFNVAEGMEALSTWTLEVKDKKGNIQTFGPYTEREINIPGKTILGDETEGDYHVTMVGEAKNGMIVKKDTTVHMKLWTPPAYEEGMRFSIIYEFDDTEAINIYRKYLSEVVTPKIPMGGLVQIHGYTDIIGDEAYNQRLSLARANDVRTIIENSLSNLGRSDVKFEVFGFGEKQSQFGNNLPEERFYNRTVIIDIVPKN